MSDPTIPCPNCSEYVLEDTAQCLSCGYSFVTKQVEALEQAAFNSEGKSTTAEVSCPECGAENREHLVRCWKCRAFIREDIAETYKAMEERLPKVEFQPLRDLDEALEQLEDADDDPNETVDYDGAVPEIAGFVAEEEAPTYTLAGADSDDEDDFEVDFDLDDDDEFDYDGEYGEDDDEIEDEAADAAAEQEEEQAAAAEGEAEDGEKKNVAEGPAVAHSDDTGGDALLEIAIQEEAELEKRRSNLQKKFAARAVARKKRLADRRAGIVPKRPRKKRGPVAGKYKLWMTDVALHVANPKKTKAKPGAIEKPTEKVDVGFAEDGVIVVSCVQKGSLLKRAPKPEEVRKQVLEHLKKDGKLEDLPAEMHWIVPPDDIRSPAFEQPNEYAHETVFGGVPVFGEGRIGLRIKLGEDDDLVRFLSFSLTTFRRFSKYLKATYGTPNLGADRGIPLKDEPAKLTCHYTEAEFAALPDATYHRADPEIELKLVGRRCQNCELVVCEDGRKKERIGGKTGSGIAKAKCPKCGEKFGETSLYEIVEKQPATKKPAPAKV